jgi:hypothetical protein
MTKRKTTSNSTITAVHDTKRVRTTVTPAATQTLQQSNSGFFSRLSRDARNIIYSYLTLPPVRTQDTNESAGLVLSCRPAKEEAKAEGHLQALLFIQSVRADYAAAFHNEIKLVASIQTAEDLTRLRKLTLVLERDVGYSVLKHLEKFAALELDELRIHYTGTTTPTAPITDICFSRALCILRDLCGKVSDGPKFLQNDLWIKKQVVSWDYRTPGLKTTAGTSETSANISSPAQLTLFGSQYQNSHGVPPPCHHRPADRPIFTPQNLGPLVIVAKSETGDVGMVSVKCDFQDRNGLRCLCWFLSALMTHEPDVGLGVGTGVIRTTPGGSVVCEEVE